MTHAGYTTINISSYTTEYLRQNHRGSGMVWNLESDGGGGALVRQSAGLIGTSDYQILTGAYVSWSNPPSHDTIIQGRPGYNFDGPSVAILLSSSVSATTLSAVMTPQPIDTGPTGFANITAETVWDDDVTTVIGDIKFVHGGPAYMVTLDLNDKRSGTNVNAKGIRLVTPYGPDPHLAHFLGQPFALGNVTIEFSDLRYVSGHLEVDYAVTGGLLSQFDRVTMSLIHHLDQADTFGQMQCGAFVLGEDPPSGTAAFIYGDGNPASQLYQGDTDPTHYIFSVERQDLEAPYDPTITAGNVGRYNIYHNEVAQTPFTVTDTYDPIIPVTLPHTTLFDWSQAVDTS